MTNIILKDSSSILYETDRQELLGIADAWYKAWLREISLGNWLHWLDIKDPTEFKKVAENNYYLKNYIKFSDLAQHRRMFFVANIKRDLENARLVASSHR